MKNLLSKLLVLLLLLSVITGCFVACNTDDNGGEQGGGEENNGPGEFIDYAAEVKLDRNSGRANAEVTVKTFVDGDTTHFNVPKTVSESGVLKARYLAVNTPESTGQIEPWGKKASEFTKNKLSAATSIVIESDTATWNPDSTGERFLVWVWYKTAEMTDYRCLNMEILQSGLARSSKSSDTVYASQCTAMLNQAVNHQLYVFSKDKDPEFYYGAAIPMTLKELKTNIETYKGKSVSFEGVIVKESSQTVYVEEYDEETGLYFGMQVYYGFNLDWFGTEILKVGNRVRIVGSVQYYETGGTYQISDIYYNAMDPENEKNIKLISSGHSASYSEMSANDILNGKETFELTVVDEDGNESIVTKTLDKGFLSMHSSASLKNLTITDLYTTRNEESSMNGAISITCVDEYGNEIVLRTVVLTDASGNVVTEDAFHIGDKISAKGVIDVYDGAYQLKIFSMNDITFEDAQ